MSALARSKRSAESSVSVQALWFRTDKWTYAAAKSWAEQHEFVTDSYHERLDPDSGEVSHHIFRQWSPDQAQDDSWATLSDGWPDGITVSTAKRKSVMSMKYTKGVQSVDDPMEFVMSSEVKDRVGDVIEAKGWQLDDFKKNPIALWGHSHDKPIGTWENVRVEGKRLLGRLKLAAKGTSAEIDTIRSLIEQRILKSVSVGFSPLEYEPMEKGIKFIRQSLHECSLVAVPCHQDALATGKSFGLSEAQTKRLLEQADSEGHDSAPAKVDARSVRKGTAVRPDARKLQRLIDKINTTLGE